MNKKFYTQNELHEVLISQGNPKPSLKAIGMLAKQMGLKYKRLYNNNQIEIIYLNEKG